MKATDSPLLHLTGIVKVFRKGREVVRAVDGVDLKVERQQTVGLIGESGSGKSTLGRIALALTRPDAGSVVFDGQVLGTLDTSRLRAVRSDLQVVFQEPFESLNPQMTILECVREPLDVQSARSPRAERDRLALAALDRVGLGSLSRRYPAQLSGGQQQRVGIARAIVVRPKLIVLDEPTSSLDLTVRAGVLQLLTDLQRDLGMAYLFISHDLTTIEHFADDVVVLRRGVVVEQGPVSRVVRSPSEVYTRQLLDARLSVVPP